jgi:peptidoglycan/LPS O-acetylase OafA/YrhL
MFKRKTIYSHIALRGIAALSVFLFHIYDSHGTAGWDLNNSIFRFFDWADYSVDLFFILSGFVLNWVYNKQVIINWRTYGIARIARIVPLYYITSIVAIPVLVYSYLRHGSEYIGIGPGNIYSVAIENILILAGVLNTPTLNGPAWSISVEVFCYAALFPILFKVNKKIEKSCLVLISLVLGCTFLLNVSYHYYYITFQHIVWNTNHIQRGIFGFTMGFCLCALYRLNPMLGKRKTQIDLILGLIIILVISSLIGILPKYMILYSLPFLVFFSAYDSGVIASAMHNSVFEWLGERSYSIYLWHYSILAIYPYLIKSSFIPGIVNCGILVIIVLIIAELSYRFIEVPSRDYLRQYLGRR